MTPPARRRRRHAELRGAAERAAASAASLVLAAAALLAGGGCSSGVLFDRSDLLDPCGPQAVPAELAGWIPADVGSDACPVLLPPNAASIPTLDWTACPDEPDDGACKAAAAPSSPALPLPALAVDSSGRTLLSYQRSTSGSFGAAIVEDVDGGGVAGFGMLWDSASSCVGLNAGLTPQAHTGVLIPNDDVTCQASTPSGLRVIAQVFDGGDVAGVQSGMDADLSSSLFDAGRRFVADDAWIVASGPALIVASDWSGSLGAAVASLPDNGSGGTFANVVLRAGAVFYETRTSTTTALSVFTIDGNEPFLTSPDPTHQAADFGTDGTTMAWTAHVGAADEPLADWWKDDALLMTAPFTTSPAAVVPRQVAVIHGSAIGDNTAWVVGCGHAARPSGPIVRLSDGARADLDPDVERRIFGVSCAEVFVATGDLGIQRLRLDSLTWSP